MAEQIQERINVRMKSLDDVFHRMIIALERLETFLEIHRRGGEAAGVELTGMHGSRDLHDDQKNPPSIESVLGEVQLQCSSLFFQTKLDDEKLFEQTMKYFMSDLLAWYGGRSKDMPYDEVEMYVLPIIVSLSRQIGSVIEIMKVCDDYVAKVRRIEDFSDEEKEKAVQEGFSAFLTAQHQTGEQMQEFIASGAEVKLSAHKRGTALDGYNRLMDAMIKLYDTNTPAKKVRNTFSTYVDGLPEFADETLEKAMATKGQTQESEENQESDKPELLPIGEAQEAPQVDEISETQETHI